MMELKEAVKAHQDAWEEWREGKPVNAYSDRDGNLCIEYESGKKWHYKKENQQIIWW